MSTSREKGWLVLSVLLIMLILAGGIVFGIRQFGGNNSIEITPPTSTSSAFEISVTGAVANNGIYTFNEESSVGDIINTAGDYIDGADTESIKIHIPFEDEDSLVETQKININIAESWLLEALPDIGSTLALRIIEYREAEGPFRSIDELTEVDGIGDITLEQIRDKVTVFD